METVQQTRQTMLRGGKHVGQLLKNLMGTITINGKTYTGNSIIISNNEVYIDGERADSEGKQINISVQGDIEKLHVDACSLIKVAGDVGIASSVSGDIDIQGNVSGNASTTSGDIEAHTIHGGASSVSGDINSQNIIGLSIS